MGKKRSRDQDGLSGGSGAQSTGKTEQDGGSDEEEDFSMIEVSFEWFNYDAEIDFHGVKTLLRQLLDVDAGLIDLSRLADLVLLQPTIGSTIKVDGKDSDAFAMMTVLSASVHRDAEPVRDLLAYLARKAGTNPALAPVVAELNAADSSIGRHIGLVFSERLINMPAEVAPPMYSMLVDEIEAAVEDKEPYDFSHYLILSRTYIEVQSTLDAGEDRKRKKAKEDLPSTFYFHPEDEVFHQHAVAFGGFTYTKEGEVVSDSKRAFQELGIKTQGHMIMIEASKFPAAVKAVHEFVSSSSRD